MKDKILFLRAIVPLLLLVMMLGIMLSSVNSTHAQVAGTIDPTRIPRSLKHFVRERIDSVADVDTPYIAPGKAPANRLQSQASAQDGQSAQAPVETIPYFTSSFTYNGTSYPFHMVGTDPAKGSATTVVPTLLFPLKLKFADGSVFDSSQLVNQVIESPMFIPGKFDSGFTQYGDAIQRAEFWKYVSQQSKNYHVLLTPPLPLPTITVDVPADQGHVETISATGKKVGVTSGDFTDKLVMDLYTKYHISPKVFPIFLVGDVFPAGAFGYHSAFPSKDQKQLFTYTITNWLSKGETGREADEDASTLAHEVLEWIDDPFVLDPTDTTNTTGLTINITPEWYADGYDCQNVLEVGDPVVIYAFRYKGINNFTYHLQDIVYLSWFARQVPSIALGGRYTYMDTFKGPSTDCPAPTPTPTVTNTPSPTATSTPTSGAKS